MSRNRIKVFFFIDSFRIGGMHRQVLNLVKHLNKDIFEPVMCTSSPHGSLRGEYEQTGCELFDLGWKRALDPATVIRLIKILHSQNPDIVFITEAQNLFYYRIAKLFWIKKTVQIGSFRALTFWKGHLKKHYQPIDNLFSKWLYNSSDSIVVNSVAMKDHYSNIIKINQKKPIQVIYNGSDFTFPITKSVTIIKQELNISSNEIIIIMVARLDPWKDFITLLEAADIILKIDSRAKFLIVGDGELKMELDNKIAQMGLNEKILLLGEKKDAINYINAADISVLSTNGEGFSNSILESMSLGKPVIATNVGGNAELLDITGKCGILVPPNSPELFANAILHLMKNEITRKLMGEAAKERIFKLCNIENHVTTYENLFLQKMEKN